MAWTDIIRAESINVYSRWLNLFDERTNVLP